MTGMQNQVIQDTFVGPSWIPNLPVLNGGLEGVLNPFFLNPSHRSTAFIPVSQEFTKAGVRFWIVAGRCQKQVSHRKGLECLSPLHSNYSDFTRVYESRRAVLDCGWGGAKSRYRIAAERGFCQQQPSNGIVFRQQTGGFLKWVTLRV